MKKFFEITVPVITVILVIIAVNYRSLVRSIKEKEHFAYRNIDYIGVKLDMGSYVTDVYDAAVIAEILQYLNSMTLIKEKIPKKDRADYSDDREKYKNKLENIGYFIVSVSDDLLCFSTEYVSVTSDGQNYTSYYIVDSGFDSEANTSRFHDFLYALLKENAGNA